MHREPYMTLPYKGQTSTYDNHFSNFGRSSIPDNLCKDSVTGHPGYWIRRFLMYVFTIYRHDGHLGQPAGTISEIIHFPDLRRLHMKF